MAYKADFNHELDPTRPFEVVIDIVKKYIDEVRLIFPVTRSLLFGSFAKGLQTYDSDIDIAIFFETFGSKSRSDIGLIANKMTIKYGHFAIEPHIFLDKNLNSNHYFIKEILETGIQIFPEPKPGPATP